MEEQHKKLVTELLVKGAIEKEVGNILRGGGTVGAVGRGAGSLSEGSSWGAVASGSASWAVPVLIRRGSIKGGVEAAAVPGGVAFTTKHDGVRVFPSVNMAVGAGLVVEALLLSSTAVAGSVGGEPMGAAAKARHSAAVGVGDGVVAEVGLRGE